MRGCLFFSAQWEPEEVWQGGFGGGWLTEEIHFTIIKLIAIALSPVTEHNSTKFAKVFIKYRYSVTDCNRCADLFCITQISKGSKSIVDILTY